MIIAAVSSSPFPASFVERGLEVLNMADPMDEYAVQHLMEFDRESITRLMKEVLYKKFYKQFCRAARLTRTLPSL